MDECPPAALGRIRVPVSKDLAVQIIGLSVVFLIALMLRLVPSPMETARGGLGQFGDSNLYHQLAFNLYTGRGFSAADDGSAYALKEKQPGVVYEPAVTRAPGYPVFMSLVYRFCGSSGDPETPMNRPRLWRQVRNVQAFLDASLCITIFFMVRRLIPAGGCGPALLAALVYCFGVYNIYYTKALLSESLATFFITWALFFFITGLKIRSPKNWIGAGAFLGLTVLTRPEYLLFVPLLAIPAYLFFPAGRCARAKAAALLVLSAAVVILPWTIRNYVVFGKLIPVSTGGLGYNLFIGTFETNDNWAGWGKFPAEIFADDEARQKIRELSASFGHLFKQGSIRVEAVDREFMHLAKARIAQDPTGVLKIWLLRLPRLWYQHYIQMYGDREASGLFFVFYFVFATIALVSGTRDEKILMLPIACLFVYLNLVFLPLHIEPRYGVSVMPALICLTGVGIWKTYVRLIGSKTA